MAAFSIYKRRELAWLNSPIFPVEKLTDCRENGVGEAPPTSKPCSAAAACLHGCTWCSAAPRSVSCQEVQRLSSVTWTLYLPLCFNRILLCCHSLFEVGKRYHLSADICGRTVYRELGSWYPNRWGSCSQKTSLVAGAGPSSSSLGHVLAL